MVDSTMMTYVLFVEHMYNMKDKGYQTHEDFGPTGGRYVSTVPQASICTHIGILDSLKNMTYSP